MNERKQRPQAIEIAPTVWRLARTRIKSPGIFLSILGVGGLLLLVSFWLDQRVFDWVHQNYNHHTRPIPDFLKLPTRLLRSLEDWGENVYISIVCFCIWSLDRQHRGRIICLFLAALCSAFTVEAIKRSAGRLRPEVSQSAGEFQGPRHSLDALGDAHSFPSGHVAAAATYSGMLTAFYPALRPAAIFLACGCSASRIWKERHFLSDCIAGGLIGWWIAFLFAKHPRLAPFWQLLDRRLAPKRAGEPRPTSAIPQREDRAYFPSWGGIRLGTGTLGEPNSN